MCGVEEAMKEMTAFQSKHSNDFGRSFAKVNSGVRGEGLGRAKGGTKESGTKTLARAQLRPEPSEG